MKISAVESVCIFAAICMVLVFTVFRFSFLATVPAGFFVDESSIGYNAWSIFTKGVDEHGAVYPLYFKAFGDYKNPVYIYSVAPLVGFFGASVTSVRMASALWGGAAVLVFLQLLTREKFSRFAFWAAALLFISSPWLVQLSRVAFEVAAVPFFILLSVYAFYVLSHSEPHHKNNFNVWLLVFISSLMTSFYVYTSLRMLAPQMLGFGLVLLRKKIGVFKLIVAALFSALFLVPLFFSKNVTDGSLLSRYAVVGLYQNTHSLGEFFAIFSVHYLKHFLPHFLFWGGDENLRHGASPYGVFYTTGFIFFLLGCWAAFKKRTSIFFQWLIFSLLIGPIPAALTVDTTHILRSVVFITIAYVVAAQGIYFLAESGKWHRVFASSVTLLMVVQSLFFLHYYFGTYAQISRIWFDADTVAVLQNVREYPEPIYIPQNLYLGTYVTALFFGANTVTVQPQVKTILPSNTTTYLPGTYILNYPACGQALQRSDIQVLFGHEGACAAVLRQ